MGHLWRVSSSLKKNIDITPNIETLFGTRDENLRLLEDGLNVTIDLLADAVKIEGAAQDVQRAEQVFNDYDHLQRAGFGLCLQLHALLRRAELRDLHTLSVDALPQRSSLLQ